LRVKVHLAATAVAAAVNPIQLAPASTAWRAAVVVVHDVMAAAVVVVAAVDLAAAVAAEVVAPVVAVAAMVAATAVAVRSAAD
jgi:hypothetical protein